MEWNVYRYAFNSHKLKAYNIFDHAFFRNDCVTSARKNKDNDEVFLKDVKSSLMYYFWSKCEHEIVISSFPPREDVEEKIDVYSQVMLNWDRFSEYILANKGKLRRTAIVK